MKIPLAWLNLRHEKTRTAVAVAGVAFAVILVLMQLGFAGSVRQTATQIYDELEFDILLISPRYSHLAQAGVIRRERLYQARSVSGVASTAPLYLGFAPWRIPDSGLKRGIFLIGFNVGDEVFRLPEVKRQAAQLSRPGHVLMDRFSRREFGERSLGFQTDVGRTQITLAGEFSLGTGFGADGALIVGDATFARIVSFRTLDDISLGLVRIDPGADPQSVAAGLNAQLPADVRALTRAQIEDRDRDRWVAKTSVGVIFGLGVLLALLVGTAIVYQVLSSDIDNRLSEFATLKAMGYGSAYLGRVVLSQAWMLAIAGYLPGLAASLLLYWVTQHFARIPMEMDAPRAAFVLAMALAMCSVSGLVALRKVQTVDPAELFR